MYAFGTPQNLAWIEDNPVAALIVALIAVCIILLVCMFWPIKVDEDEEHHDCSTCGRFCSTPPVCDECMHCINHFPKTPDWTPKEGKAA